jgi:hypothetical protein
MQSYDMLLQIQYIKKIIITIQLKVLLVQTLRLFFITGLRFEVSGNVPTQLVFYCCKCLLKERGSTTPNAAEFDLFVLPLLSVFFIYFYNS